MGFQKTGRTTTMGVINPTPKEKEANTSQKSDQQAKPAQDQTNKENK